MVKMRIPTNKEWDELVEVTGGDDNKMHWKEMLSWVNDTEGKYHLSPIHRAGCGYYSARHFIHYLASSPVDRYGDCGFRPAFENLKPDTLVSDIKKGDVVTVGTLYVNGKPVKVPQNPTWNGDIVHYGFDATLEMREALNDPAFQVKGIYIGNGIYIADRVLLQYISYKEVVRYASGDDMEPTSTWNFPEEADIYNAGIQLLDACTNDYAARIWEVIAQDVVEDVKRTLDIKNEDEFADSDASLDDGFADSDVALAIGKAVASRLGIEI